MGPLLLREDAVFLVIDQRADQVGRQQVGRELDTLKAQGDGLGQALDGERFGQARHAFEQHMAAREQADQQPLDHHLLADDPLAQFGHQRLEEFAFRPAGLFPER